MFTIVQYDINTGVISQTAYFQREPTTDMIDKFKFDNFRSLVTMNKIGYTDIFSYDKKIDKNELLLLTARERDEVLRDQLKILLKRIL